MEQNAEQIHISGGDADLKGVYSNIAQISHTKEEFRVDFFNMHMPREWMLLSRVYLSPGHAKRLIAALSEQMAVYEGVHGSVTPAEEPKGRMGFKTN